MPTSEFLSFLFSVNETLITGDEDEAWECKIGSKICFNEKTFKHALQERCREKVFEIQSRLPLLLSNHKKYLVVLTNLLFAAYFLQHVILVYGPSQCHGTHCLHMFGVDQCALFD